MTTKYDTFRACFLALFLASGLAACGLFGDGPDVDTTRKAIVLADAEINAANDLLADLFRRGVIPSEDAAQALVSLRQAHTALRRAADAVNVAGDPLAAENELQAANAALSIALTLIGQYQRKEP